MAADAAGEQFATFTFYATARPFAMLTSTQFLPPPPPTLSSTRYATDFNEVKSMGFATSVLRTTEQTLMTQVHAGVNTQVGFDNEASQAACPKVPEFTAQHFMLPRNR